MTQTLRRELIQKFSVVLQRYAIPEGDMLNELADAALSVSGIARRVPDGLPTPTGDAVGDWLEMTRRIQEKHSAETAVLKALEVGLNYNFPNYGENPKFDRIAKLIARDGRAVETFCKWAEGKKRDPYWYHVNPDTLWGDWPQAFTTLQEQGEGVFDAVIRERNRNGNRSGN
jgi:hypothetical protein